MSFFESLRVVLVRKYIKFSGRAGRSEYWWFTLFATVLLVGVAVPLAMLVPKDSLSAVTAAAILSLIQMALLLALAVPTMTVTARRLHDIGMSGWWQLLNLIPGLGTLAVLFLASRRGDAEANRYGASLDSGETEFRSISVAQSLLRKSTTLLAAWGVIAALCVTVAMGVLSIQSEDVWLDSSSTALAGWLAAVSGLWPDTDMSAGWLAPFAGFLLGVVGVLVLTRYRKTRPPRALAIIALVAGLISITSSAALAMTYGGMGFATIVQYTLFPFGFLTDGYTPGEAVNALWQVGASMTMAWILVFAIWAFRSEPALAGPVETEEAADVSVG